MMPEPKSSSVPNVLCDTDAPPLAGFQGRWSDGWISRVYCVTLPLPRSGELELQINGRHQASDTFPLGLRIRANGLDLGRHELARGPFRLRFAVDGLSGPAEANLTLECDAAWRPDGGGDDRELSCLIDAIRVIDRTAIGYFGDYSSWEEALSESDGYGAPIVFERTRAALLQVKNGTAVHERDSVLFPKVEHNFALVAGLLQAVENGELRVLDFGGSLGSSYFQCRPFLASLRSVRWSIVEQPAYVECGRRDFADERLRFYGTVEEYLEHESPQVLLLSGVIHCLADPYGFLAKVLAHRFPSVIVDRTAFLSRGVDRLTVERVPEWIYPASYPSWFLSEERFLSHFREGYELISDFPALDTNQPEGESAYYKGYIFRAMARLEDVAIPFPAQPAIGTVATARHFCTYFDSAYFERGIALYESLDRLYPAFTLWVLCFDESTWKRMTAARLSRVRLIRIEDLERATAGLQQARGNRTPIEYYFTCSPALPKYILETFPAVNLVTYLDADIYFYASPEALFTELGDRSIGIIRHKCSQLSEKLYGIFNVGWVSFRRDKNGLACLSWWLERCLEWCYGRTEDGRYADQKYLDSFPERFDGVAVLENVGANVAAWNIEKSDLRISGGEILAGDVPLLFFHFHGLRQVDYLCYETGFENYGARLTEALARGVIEPYVRVLLRITKRELVAEAGLEVSVSDRQRSLESARVRLEALRADDLEDGVLNARPIVEEQRRIHLLNQELDLLRGDVSDFSRRIRFVWSNFAATASAERLEALRCVNYLLAGDQAKSEDLREEAARLISRVTVSSQRFGVFDTAAGERLEALSQGNRLLIQERRKGAHLRQTVVDLGAELTVAQRDLDAVEVAAAERLMELQGINLALAKEQELSQELREQVAQLTSERSVLGQQLEVVEPAVAERLEALAHGNRVLIEERAKGEQLRRTVLDLAAELTVAQRDLDVVEVAAAERLIELRSINQELAKEQALSQELREQAEQLTSEWSLLGQRLVVIEPAAAERADALHHIRALLVSERSFVDSLRRKLAKLTEEFVASSQRLVVVEAAAAERLEELVHLNRRLVGEQGSAAELRQQVDALSGAVCLAHQRLEVVEPAATDRLRELQKGNFVLAQEREGVERLRGAVARLKVDLDASSRRVEMFETATEERAKAIEYLNRLVAQERTAANQLRDEADGLFVPISAT